MTLDESIELWQKEHEHEIVYACNMDAEVHDIVDRVNPWHTGTPTEDGWYLVAFNYEDEEGVRYTTDYFKDGKWAFPMVRDISKVVKWQKIEENKDGRTD